MSSAAAASPAAVAPGFAHVRRPSTLTVWRWELRKLVSQKRTYLGLTLAVIPPLLFVVFQNVHQRHGHGDENIFASQITHSGLATPVLMLLFESVLLLPVIAALVAGDIVANEDGNGTLKTILTRSVDRGQVFAAKALAAIYRQSVIGNMLNPKVTLFFLAFLPQFVDAKAGHVGGQMALLGAIFMAQTVVIFGAVAVFSGWIGAWMRAKPAIGERLNVFAGVTFIALGVRVALPGFAPR